MLALSVGAERANGVIMLHYIVTPSQLCICTDVCAAQMYVLLYTKMLKCRAAFRCVLLRGL